MGAPPACSRRNSLMVANFVLPHPHAHFFFKLSQDAPKMPPSRDFCRLFCHLIFNAFSDASKTTQDASKTPPRGPKMPPRRPKTPTRGPRRPPRADFWFFAVKIELTSAPDRLQEGSYL